MHTRRNVIVRTHVLWSVVILAGALASAACDSSAGKAAAREAAPPPPVAITTAPVVIQPIPRFLRVTGTLMADEQAEVSAETAGRVVATPVERGSRVAAGSVLARLSPTETEAQLREAEANAGQIEARLAIKPGQEFDIDGVPEVLTAASSLRLAEAEFGRITSLLGQRVVSQSEYDQRRTQVESARQQFQVARNAAQQQYQALQAARARVALARKALADTTVRAPFAGLVAERRVSIGDYVTRGAHVATVVRVDPLRVELTVPEQAVAKIRVGEAVSLTVDAYSDKTFEGQVRFVSPAVRADQRSLTVEALVPNRDGLLKPGLFATARVQIPTKAPARLVPAAAVQTTAGTSRVFVVKGDRVEERIVTTGQAQDSMIEITDGVSGDEIVATGNLSPLADGARVRVESRPAAGRAR
jgi:multidrug efflux pump subunit AcrA (membrane-fusion protein)